MQKIKTLLQNETFMEGALLSLVSIIVYLWFVSKFGYFNDDWYLMYAAGARGASVFWDVFAIDRPLRALVMIPAYSLFGSNQIYYNLAILVFRVIGAFCFLWLLRMIWKEDRRTTFWMALLFVLYPGFLSLPNAIDYLCHIVGLAAGMLSLALTIKSIQASATHEKVLFYMGSVISGWFYLGQIEWYIGLEFLRFAFVFLLSYRQAGELWSTILGFIKNALPAAVIPAGFLIWRLFFFESERGATDVDLQLTDIRTQPYAFLLRFLSLLWNDIVDVLIRAWWQPYQWLRHEMNGSQRIMGVGIALFVLLLVWISHKFIPQTTSRHQSSNWKLEGICISLGMLLFGLLPILLVGRTVTFESFSRYTLIASVGAAVFWPILISHIPGNWLRNILISVLIISAAFTQYANGAKHARETQATRDFWWQVSWRIPQLEKGTTLITHYSVVAEEDYFTWGPANLIYDPSSQNEKYAQTSIYAVLLNEETVEKVLSGEGREFSNRRSIRTYPNYRNILILTKPSRASCVQVIDLRQVELSSAEDPRVVAMAAYSEAEHILAEQFLHTPPIIPFGTEPAYGWCYFYEKAAYARQQENWAEVASLAEQVHTRGLAAGDPIEWMPFLQANAYFDHISEMRRIAPLVSVDQAVKEQACRILTSMSLKAATQEAVKQLFCAK